MISTELEMAPIINYIYANDLTNLVTLKTLNVLNILTDLDEFKKKIILPKCANCRFWKQ